MNQIENRALLSKYIAAYRLQEHFSSPLSELISLVRFEPRETMIQRGCVSRHLYFLVSGRVRFFIEGRLGANVNFGYARIGDPIGEVGSLWNKKPQISVQAAEASLCAAIDLEIYREKLLDDNVFLRFICGKLSDSIALLNLSIIGLAKAPAAVRIAACILQNMENGFLTPSLSECAEQAAVSYRHFIRILNRLCEASLLKKEKRKYVIIDADALEGMTEGWMQ